MKIDKIKEMSSPELEKELSELKTELFKLRFSLATNGLENPMKIKEVKKDKFYYLSRVCLFSNFSIKLLNNVIPVYGLHVFHLNE